MPKENNLEDLNKVEQTDDLQKDDKEDLATKDEREDIKAREAAKSDFKNFSKRMLLRYGL